MRLDSFLWLIFGIALLGWYGFAIVIVGAIIYIIVAAIIERKNEKKRRESGAWPSYYRNKTPKRKKSAKRSV